MKLEADYFLICTGERPVTELPGVPGLNFAMTSDELFKIKSRPNSVLVLGNGYVAMEVASLMQGLGVNTKIYHRSRFLSSFDEEMRKELIQNLSAEGAILREDLDSIEITHSKEHKSDINSGKSGNKISLDGEYTVRSSFKSGEKFSEEFDLVINALARKTDLRFLDNLQGELKINSRQRIVGGYDGMMEKSSVKNIFAAGDCLEHSPRNEPGAAIGGRRVAQYIKSEIDKDSQKLSQLASFRFKNTPYCLFTCPEIAGVGLTEDQAKVAYPENQFRSIRLKKTSYLEKLIGLNP